MEGKRRSRKEINILKELKKKFKKIPTHDYSSQRASTPLPFKDEVEELEARYMCGNYYTFKKVLEENSGEFMVRGVSRKPKDIISGHIVMNNCESCSKSSNDSAYCSFAKKLMPIFETNCKSYVELFQNDKNKGCFNNKPMCSCKDAMDFVTNRLSEVGLEKESDFKKTTKLKKEQPPLVTWI